ncbi:MAG: hypothetical protein Q9167_003649 [Letrouitia subvulpina]
MSKPNKSLRDFLSRTNPCIECGGRAGGTNTQCDPTKWESPKVIKLWKDFTANSLNAMYGGSLEKILEHQFEFQDHWGIPPFPFCEVWDEDSLESLIIRWNYPVVSDALAKAQILSEGRTSHELIYMAKGGQAKSLLPNRVLDKSSRSKKDNNFERNSNGPPRSRKGRMPDWAGIKRSLTMVPRLDVPTQYHNVLPGDTKLSKKWKSSDIEFGPVKQDKQGSTIYPINQIFTYCVRANARYGYLITDEELVVIRIRPRLSAKSSVDGSDYTAAMRAADDGLMECRSISWASDHDRTDPECEGLTVNLALWWLHMLAAAGHDIQDKYTPLKGITKPTSSFDSFASFDNGSQELFTPSPQGLDFLNMNQSFRSVTSDVRADLADSSIYNHDGETSPTPNRSSRKRSRNDQNGENNRLAQRKRRESLRNRA